MFNWPLQSRLWVAILFAIRQVSSAISSSTARSHLRHCKYFRGTISLQFSAACNGNTVQMVSATAVTKKGTPIRLENQVNTENKTRTGVATDWSYLCCLYGWLMMSTFSVFSPQADGHFWLAKTWLLARKHKKCSAVSRLAFRVQGTR